MNYERISAHADKGHVIEFVIYGNNAYALECTQCGEIVADFEPPPELDIETKLAGTEIPEEYFDDLVIDHCTADASAINNCGFVDQLEFLHGRGEDIGKLIEEAKNAALRQENVHRAAVAGDD